MMMATETITRPEAEIDTPTVVETETTDEPGKAAHIVMVPEGEPDQTPQAYVLRATIEGFPVTAVCGWVWVPGKLAEKLPLCAPCREIYDYLVKPDQGHQLPEA